MVKRAADEAAGPVHTLGPLIHNPRVVDGLAARGVTVVESPEEAAGGTLLLPKYAHTGVTFAAAVRPFAPDWRWKTDEA